MTEKKKDEAQTKETMRLWDRVCKTDVDHTKEVSFGRKFTAIDAHSQIMEATRLFGPVGEGWGYKNQFGSITIPISEGKDEVYVTCDVTIWWSEFGQWEGMATPGNRREFGPIRGMCQMKGYKADGKVKPTDHDAAKKAMTDALTKGLSHLGFNADVFLGMFDDNKYVQDLKKEKDAAAGTAAEEYAQSRNKFIKDIGSCKATKEMDALLSDWKTWIDRLPPGTAVELRGWVAKQKAELKKGEGTST